MSLDEENRWADTFVGILSAVAPPECQSADRQPGQEHAR
jgi:hypothetical protein